MASYQRPSGPYFVGTGQRSAQAPSGSFVVDTTSTGGGGTSQTVAFTLEGIAAAVSQVAGHAQSASATLDGVTFAASQVAGHSQTLAASLDGITFSASQSIAGGNSQSIAITLDGIQVSASQTVGHSQSASVALDGVLFASAQTLGHGQSLAAVLDGVSFAATQSAASPNKQQAIAFTLDGIAFDAQQAGPAAEEGHGFVMVDFEPRLWWQRKPKALDEKEAAEKIAAVARQIERVAVKQVKAGRVVQPVVTKPAKSEIRQAIAPQVEQMPGFDWVALYRNILDRLIAQEAQRQAEAQAAQIAQQEIERIRLMEQDEDDVLVLLMGS